MRWNEKGLGRCEEAFRLNEEAKGTQDSCGGAETNKSVGRVRLRELREGLRGRR